MPSKGRRVIGRRALIGYTGFLGTTLNIPGRFTDFYNSKNIHELEGEYDLIVVAAPSASKWWANDQPEEDSKGIDAIRNAIFRSSARRVVLLSTIDATFDHPYGRHRLWLEQQMPHNSTVLRLPALYGPGLRKNALYDLLAGKPVANQVYHWYSVARLWGDVQAAQPGLWLKYSAPLSMWEIAERLERTGQVHLTRDPHKDYGEPGPYTMTSQEVLEDIVRWVKSGSR
jgi:hypothetical protein